MLMNIDNILQLSTAEKILIVEKIWDNIAENTIGKKLSSTQIKELDKRIKNANQHPERLVEWETVKSKMKNVKK